jgi:hypothetical protein
MSKKISPLLSGIGQGGKIPPQGPPDPPIPAEKPSVDATSDKIKTSKYPKKLLLFFICLAINYTIINNSLQMYYYLIYG